MNQTVLLTGGTGFIGRYLASQLSVRGYVIRYVVRKRRAEALLPDTAIESVIETQDMFQESAGWWAKACEGIDTVVHAAWYAEPGKYLYDDRNFACLSGSINLGRGAAVAAVRRFVGLGSCSEYDASAGMLSHETPLKPASPYAAAKAATFLNLSQWLRLNDVAFAWCRLFYLHGEGEDDRRLVSYIRRQLRAGLPADLTSGDQIRDFLHVSTAASLIADVVTSDVQGPVNICSGVPVTVRHFAESIADEYGRRDLLRFGAKANPICEPPVVVGVPNLPTPKVVH